MGRRRRLGGGGLYLVLSTTTLVANDKGFGLFIAHDNSSEALTFLTYDALNRKRKSTIMGEQVRWYLTARAARTIGMCSLDARIAGSHLTC